MNNDSKNTETYTEKNGRLAAGEGIRFFGKMTASATHEIKNALAIMNESAGLLEDLTHLAENGLPLVPDRIQRISKSITRQVHRADQIVKKLNRFSHSADLKTEVVDFEKTVCFMMEMASRLLDQQEISVEVTPPRSPLLIATNLFYLENLIWKAVEAACSQPKGQKRLHIFFKCDSAHPSIWFSAEVKKINFMEDLFGSPEDKALLTEMGISIVKDRIHNTFGFVWPKQN